MKTIAAVFTTLIVAFILSVSAADESKDHLEDKRMIYWKRGVTSDLENDELPFVPRLENRNRFERPSYHRKRMIYW
nr:neuropeptide [Hymenolepis microstoma]